MTAALYGNVALRGFGDLDLFLDKRDVIRAKAVLIERGYRPSVRLDPTFEAALIEHGCEYAFQHPAGIGVELHWSLLHRDLDFPVVGCWQRLGTTMLCGHELSSFSPEDQLLALCAHRAKHGWERLVWVCDIARLIALHPRLDWSTAKRRAHAMHGNRVLLLGLRLAHRLGAPLPRHFQRRIAGDRALAGLERDVWAGMFDPDRAWTPAAKARFHLRCRDGFAQRLRNLARRSTSLNTRDWASVSLPPAFRFLHYPLRLMRLLITRNQRPIDAQRP